MVFILLFIVQAVCLFFLSRFTTNEIFYFLRLFIKDEKTNFVIVSILFLPGTILHELAHFFVAIILFMKVRDVKIFPEFREQEIKLGHVLYEKKDFFRGLLIGIAPFFAGILFFWTLSVFKLFPSANLWLNILFSYIIFAISSTMFSSKQDLVDVMYLVPLIIIAAGAVYVFDLKLNRLFSNQLTIGQLGSFIQNINFYLFLSGVINAIIILGLKGIKKITR